MDVYTYSDLCIYICMCIYTYLSPTPELTENCVVLQVQNAMPFFPVDLAFLSEPAGMF